MPRQPSSPPLVAPGAGAPDGRSARCAPPGRRSSAAGRRADAAAPPGARSPGRCTSCPASLASIGPPAGCRPPSARPVAARHRDRAALDRGGARPRLLLGFGRAPPSGGVHALGADRLDHLVERVQAVAAHERVAVGQRRRHAAGPRREAARRSRAGSPTRSGTRAATAAPSRARHERGVAALPAVREDHDESAARHAAPAVAVVELLQSVADPGPARPVRGRGGGALDRALRAARARAPASGASGGWRTRTPRRSARCRPRR